MSLVRKISFKQIDEVLFQSFHKAFQQDWDN